MISLIIETPEGRIILDDETGEVLHKQKKCEMWVQPDEVAKVFKNKPKEGRKPEFIKLYRTNIIDIIKDKDLALNERGLFLSMLVFVDWESNFIVHPESRKLLTSSSLAELIGCNRNHIYEIATRLANKGLIAIIKNGNGRGTSFMINSHLVFNGRKMKDKNEHKVFADCGYKPKKEIKY